MRKLLLFVITLFVLSFAGIVNSAHAAEFKVDIEKVYEINKPDEISVTETRTVTNISTNRLISADNNESFQIIVLAEKTEQLMPSFLSAQSYIDGKLVQNKQGEAGTDSIEIQVPYDSAVNINQKKEFKVQYINYGLTKKSGALLDIYAPGFGEDYKFETASTQYTYKTVIRLSKGLGETGFVIPVPSTVSTDDNYIIYEITQESLVGSKIWIQIGKTQYYQFSIKQDVTASDTINKGYFNEYNLVIPRNMQEAETVQKVYFTKFDPEPKQVVSDEEGNLIATFKIPSHENYTISIDGFAEVNKLEKQASIENSGQLADIDAASFIKDLNPAQFWEVNHPEIMSKAEELKGAETNIYSIIESTYTHIIDTIDYSEIKRFGINDRQGALKTLQGGAAVCMEYSDLFLTLARAQGIPARAAFGYGYDARIGEDQQDAHQWVQVFLPGMNEWLSVDVTWGESGPTLIGGDLNHFYTHVASVDPNTPPSIQRTSYGKQVGLEAPQFEIEAINSIPEGQILTESSELLSKYPKIDKNQLELLVDNLTLRIQTANIPASVTRNAQYVVYAGFGLIALAGVLFLKLVVEVFWKRKGK